MAQPIKNKQILINSDFDINNHKLINVTNPTESQDAATKIYVDESITGVTSLSTAISDETSTRTSADLSLSTAISAISGDTLELDTVLDDFELLAMLSGELTGVTFSFVVSSEMSSRISGDLSLETAISAASPTGITSLSTALSNEISSTNSDVLSLSTAISSNVPTGITSLSTIVSTEISIRGSADTSLSTQVSSEISRSTSLSTNLSSEISTRTSSDISLTSKLSSEISLRDGYDLSLSTIVSTEISTRTSSDTSITSKLSSEISTRASDVLSLSTAISSATPTGITSLSTALSNEISSTNSDVLSLSTAISGETSLRVSGDLSLSTNISVISGSTLPIESLIGEGQVLGVVGGVLTGVSYSTITSSDISAEASIRASADLSLSTAISSATPTGITSLSTALSNEISTRTSIDTSLTTQVSSEISRNTSLSTNLSSEISTRTSIDTSLTTQVSSEISRSTSLSTNLSSEISRSTSLSTNLSSEISTRGSVDSSLSIGVSTIVSTEISTRSSADTSLSSAISTSVTGITSLNTALSNEISIRSSSDTSLSTIVSTEISVRTSSDSSLSAAVNTKLSLSGGTITGSLNIIGDLFVSGTTITLDAEELRVEDNYITVNYGEPGSGVTRGTAGIIVDRGGSVDYMFEFNESTDTFRIGESGDTQAVATREDSPIDGGFAIWDSASTMFITQSSPSVVTSLSTALSNEISTRTGADTSLTTQVSSEISRSTSLSTIVSTEISVRTSADTSLTTQVSSEISRSTSLSTNLSSEISTRTSADSSLSTQVSSEISNRISGDTSLTTEVSSEISRSTSLITSISNEISTRSSADLSLSTAISDVSLDAVEPWIDINRNGFVDNTETSISFNDTTYIFTLSAVTSTWSYYRAGIKYTISGNKTITLPGTPPTAGVYYITIDSMDGTLSSGTTIWTLQDAVLPVAVIRWDSTKTPKYHLAEERHTVAIDRRMHLYLHQTRGTQFISGGALTGPTLNTATDADVCFGVSETVIADEDLYQTLSGLTRPNGTTNAYNLFYRISTTGWTWQPSEVPYKYSTTGYIEWDNNGTMQPGQVNRYYNTYVLFTDLNGAARYSIISGRGEFSSIANAQAESVLDFDWSGFLIVESLVAYQFTWSASNSYTNKGKCRLAANPVRINVATVTASSSGGGIDHNTLAGLQGGSATERYHLTESQYLVTTGLSSTISTEISDRISSDASLATNIFNEISTRTSVDNSIITQVSNEISRSTSLTTIISTEISNRVSGDTSLSTALSSEISTTDSDVLSLSTAISSMSGETENITDNLLQGDLLYFTGTTISGTTNILPSLSTSISYEISVRYSADLSLSVAISSAAPTGITSLSTSLSNEISTRASADTSLTTQVSSEISRSTILSTSISSEISSRISGDGSLTTQVSSEISRSTSLSSTLSGEISTRNSDVSSLSTAISSGTGGATSLSGLTDVSISNILDNDTLIYSGDTWVNTPNLWTVSNSAVTLSDENYNLILNTIELETDGGALTLVDMPVTTGATVGLEESYSFNIDGNSVVRIYGQASGTTGVTNTGLVLDGDYYYAGDPQTNGSWRWFVNQDGDLEFQKLTGGTWTYKSKFT